MTLIDKLNDLRNYGGAIRTRGLDDATIERFAKDHPDLTAAVDSAHDRFLELRSEMDDLLKLDEEAQMARIQADYVNFYADDAVNPYVALAAQGPWIVTLKGAVIHDNGGYGMLGFGHNPAHISEALPAIEDHTQRNWTQLMREFVADIRGESAPAYQTFKDGWIAQEIIDAVRDQRWWRMG